MDAKRVNPIFFFVFEEVVVLLFCEVLLLV